MIEKEKELSIFAFVGHTMHSFMLLFNVRLQEEGIDLNLYQYIILNILISKENLILEELSKILNKDKSAILRHINYLEAQGLIKKKVDNEDRRRKVLIVTKEGSLLLNRSRKIEQQLNHEITAGFNLRELNCFKKVLLGMNQEIKKLT